MDEPEKRFRLRPGHALLLVDLAVLVALFLIGGNAYMKVRGTKVIAAKHEEQALGRLEQDEMLKEADSVAVATSERLTAALADSARAIEELLALRTELERTVAEMQRFGQGIYILSDVVLDMRTKAEEAVKQADRDARSVRERGEEVDSLTTMEKQTQLNLVDTSKEHEDARQALLSAQQHERYDPTGRFPATTGLMVRRDVGEDIQVTNVLLQQVFWNRAKTDLGLSVGFGLGSQESTSNKEIGLLLSRSLIHRRLALDLGAGMSELRGDEGDPDRTAYASASLRLSPFYKERMHLGLGARASHDEVVPFLGLSLGRR